MREEELKHILNFVQKDIDGLELVIKTFKSDSSIDYGDINYRICMFKSIKSMCESYPTENEKFKIEQQEIERLHELREHQKNRTRFMSEEEQIELIRLSNKFSKIFNKLIYNE